jgi:hypothetical protein
MYLFTDETNKCPELSKHNKQKIMEKNNVSYTHDIGYSSFNTFIINICTAKIVAPGKSESFD